MDKKRFGQFIKEARLAKGLTQAGLAEQLYVDVTAVSKWERGVNFPDISLIADICKCLDITEHELIESSRDTEYRQMQYNSRQYLLNKKIAFWSITACFILAVLICFIVNICVSGRLSWFFIVLSGCICGYWGFLYLPLFRRVLRSSSENTRKWLSRTSLLIYSAGLLLFTLAILFTSNVYAPFDLAMGVHITLYCFIILFAFGLVELTGLIRPVKLGTDCILTGLYAVSLAKVLPGLMRLEGKNYFDVDFTDWAGHSNGNVSVIILVSFALAGIILIALGLREKSKDSKRTLNR